MPCDRTVTALFVMLLVRFKKTQMRVRLRQSVGMILQDSCAMPPRLLNMFTLLFKSRGRLASESVSRCAAHLPQAEPAATQSP